MKRKKKNKEKVPIIRLVDALAGIKNEVDPSSHGLSKLEASAIDSYESSSDDTFGYKKKKKKKSKKCAKKTKKPPVLINALQKMRDDSEVDVQFVENWEYGNEKQKVISFFKNCSVYVIFCRFFDKNSLYCQK